MALAVDSTSTKTQNNGSFPLSWTHTPVGSPNLVVVGLAAIGEEDFVRVMSVTYGALSLTDSGSSAQGPGAGIKSAFWYGVSPSSGPQTITITTDYDQSITAVGCCFAFTGANTSSPITAVTGIGSTGSTASITTGNSSGSMCLSLLGVDEIHDTITATVGGGETQQFNLEVGFNTPYIYHIIGAASLQNPATDGILNWAISGSYPYAIAAMEVKAAAVAPVPMGGAFQLMFGKP